ncbi:hypothetical protein [Aequorivita sp. CIP111184]|uniref:hypothetical protein n=1 Tax=Aequorivita sp. CIP111184 TaxID=2211356 RepID=UPI000DBBF457|nr:hypothetical protein [Aequorivita sp. CIP111184]SRX54504.1 hypothetical protein AEQU1_01515 [Aequorivita sp. CIP111184]
MPKKLLAITFFLLIAVRPAYTVSYLLYFQLNVDVIIQKYCINKDKPQMHCNGKCHLMQKLNFDTENTPTPNRAAVSFLEAFFPLYYQSNETSLPKPFVKIILLPNFNILHFETSGFINKIYHPPQVFIS